jgi:hypothetical protein
MGELDNDDHAPVDAHAVSSPKGHAPGAISAPQPQVEIMPRVDPARSRAVTRAGVALLVAGAWGLLLLAPLALVGTGHGRHEMSGAAPVLALLPAGTAACGLVMLIRARVAVAVAGAVCAAILLLASGIMAFYCLFGLFMWSGSLFQASSGNLAFLAFAFAVIALPIPCLLALIRAVASIGSCPRAADERARLAGRSRT